MAAEWCCRSCRCSCEGLEPCELCVPELPIHGDTTPALTPIAQAGVKALQVLRSVLEAQNHGRKTPTMVPPLDLITERQLRESIRELERLLGVAEENRG